MVYFIIILLLLNAVHSVSVQACKSYPDSLCYKRGLYHTDTTVYTGMDKMEHLDKDIQILRALIAVSIAGDDKNTTIDSTFCLEYFTTLACLYLYTPCKDNSPMRFCESTCSSDKLQACSDIIPKLAEILYSLNESVFASYRLPSDCSVLFNRVHNTSNSACFSVPNPLNSEYREKIKFNNNSEITRIRSESGDVNNGTVQVSVSKLAIWGDICIVNTTTEDELSRIGKVICRSLKFPHLSSYTTTSAPNNHSSIYMLSEVNCTGNETNILSCSHQRISFKYCELNRRLFVKCNPTGHHIENEMITCNETDGNCSTTNAVTSTLLTPELSDITDIYYFILLPTLIVIILLLTIISISCFLLLRTCKKSKAHKKLNQAYSSTINSRMDYDLRSNTLPINMNINLQTTNRLAVIDIPGSPIEPIESYCIGTPSAYRPRSFDSQLNANYLRDYCGEDIDQYVIPNTRLKLLESIGEGAFGIVWKAIITAKGDDETNNVDSYDLVAAKTLKDPDNDRELKDILIECALLKDLNHENILGLLAVTMIGQKPYLVTPYMVHGDIKTYLRGVRKEAISNNVLPQGLTEDMLIKMSLEVANGMEFLTHKRYVHRDLAARNCMLDSNMTVKVSDFGLSREIYISDYYRHKGGKVPAKWMAPESLIDGVFDEKTDVWAYGVTIWEIFSLGKNPYPGLGNENVLSFLENGKRLVKPAICPKGVYDLMQFCWQVKPKERPTFKLICNYTKSLNCFHEDEVNSEISAKRRKFTCKEIHDDEHAEIRVESLERMKLKKQKAIDNDDIIPFAETRNVNIDNLCLNIKKSSCQSFLTALGESQLSKSVDSSIGDRYIIPHLSISIPLLDMPQKERMKSLRYTQKKISVHDEERKRAKTTPGIRYQPQKGNIIPNPNTGEDIKLVNSM